METENRAIQNSRERIIVFDVIRVVAILLVVLNHVYDSLFYGSTVPYHSIFQALGRMGVPMFLMMTGYFQLRKEFSATEDVYKFWRSKTLKLYLATVAWIIVMFIVDGFLLQLTDQSSPFDLFKEILFLQQVPVESQMWYMPFILGVFLAIPFFAKLVHSYDVKVFILPAALVLFAAVLVPLANSFIRTAGVGEGNLSFLLDLSYFGGFFSLYIIAGYAVVKKKCLNRLKPIINLALIIAIIILGLFIGYRFEAESIWGWYDSLFVLSAGVLVFLFFYNTLKNVRVSEAIGKILKTLSDNSFKVYFLHYMVINTILKFFPLQQPNLLEAIGLFAVASFVSFAIAVVLGALKKAALTALRKAKVRFK